MLLIDDLLALPFTGFLGIFRKIYEMADRELNDEAYIQEKLLELQLLYEMDEIGEEEYNLRAAECETRLNAVRQAKEEVESEGSEADPGPGVTGEGEGVTEKSRAA
ncbi:MAG: gas vesicle protein GvpG [candidate division NC10 bacterium]|nr:gas vesicle protein GvpG [candidate division NC10 bacterium]